MQEHAEVPRDTAEESLQPERRATTVHPGAADRVQRRAIRPQEAVVGNSEERQHQVQSIPDVGNACESGRFARRTPLSQSFRLKFMDDQVRKYKYITLDVDGKTAVRRGGFPNKIRKCKYVCIVQKVRCAAISNVSIVLCWAMSVIFVV